MSLAQELPVQVTEQGPLSQRMSEAQAPLLQFTLQEPEPH